VLDAASLCHDLRKWGIKASIPERRRQGKQR